MADGCDMRMIMHGPAIVLSQVCDYDSGPHLVLSLPVASTPMVFGGPMRCISRKKCMKSDDCDRGTWWQETRANSRRPGQVLDLLTP